MSKRDRLFLFSLLLTFFLTLIPIFYARFGYLVVIVFALVALVFAAVCLWDYLSGIEYLTLLTPPTALALGMGATLIQFPNLSLVFRLIYYAAFFLVFYICLLSLNIFNVAAEKTLPLLRAAYTVGFLITIFIALPLFTLIYKSDFDLPGQILAIALAALSLSFASLWSLYLPQNKPASAAKAAVMVSLLLVETAFVFSLFPMESFFRSLLLATFFYIYLGFAHQHLRKTLTSRSLLEYLLVGTVIILIVFVY